MLTEPTGRSRVSKTLCAFYTMCELISAITYFFLLHKYLELSCSLIKGCPNNNIRDSGDVKYFVHKLWTIRFVFNPWNDIFMNYYVERAVNSKWPSHTNFSEIHKKGWTTFPSVCLSTVLKDLQNCLRKLQKYFRKTALNTSHCHNSFKTRLKFPTFKEFVNYSWCCFSKSTF